VTTVEKQLERAQAFLSAIPGAAERAMARALNRAAEVGRERAIAEIVGRYAVQPSDVREKITLQPATPSNLQIGVVARSGSLALGYFPHAPTEAGTGGRGRPVLRAEVVRGQEREVGGAFVARINGKARIMIRTGGTSKSGRTQIRSVYTVPIANMLGVRSVREAVEARAFEVLDEQLDKEIDRELGRAA
jgi:hypothetical protein